VDGVSSVRDMMAEADPDFIFGADIVYDPHFIPPLIATLRLGISAKKLAGGHPASALLALAVRRPETVRQFVEAAEQSFIVTSLCTTAIKTELEGKDNHTGEDVVIIRLDLRDRGG